MSVEESYLNYYEKVKPIKLTEAGKWDINTEGWGVITEYYLESVKISNYKNILTSAATLKISDSAGNIALTVKGSSIGFLFGLTPKDWTNIEVLCKNKQQLYYRFFKNGLNRTFSYEQKLFYNFCLTNQRNDVLVVIFRRTLNMRNKFENEAYLNILDLRKCSNTVLDLYTKKLHEQTEFHVNKTI